MSATSTTEAREIQFDEAGIQKTMSLMNKPFLYRLFMLNMVLFVFFIGMKILEIDGRQCTVTVPYRFINKNPFKTTYWAVLGMAAEMAGGALLLAYARNIKPSVATFVVGCEARFINRALGVTSFKCEDGEFIREKVALAAATGEGHTFKTTTMGYSEDGSEVSEFIFTWSVKGRKK